MRVTPTGPPSSSSAVQSPTSASTKFNVRAMEFKPNPAASNFAPISSPSTSSSPRNDVNKRPEPRKKAVSTFVVTKKFPSPSERPNIDEAFNSIKRMKKEADEEKRLKEYYYNGGIPQAYRTPPTWEVPEANREKTYLDMFERTTLSGPSISPSHSNMADGGPMPHQHQLPLHLQSGAPNMSQVHTPHQTPRHMPVQPHHHGPGGPHHFDEPQRMQYSSSQSSVHPSPRGMAQYISYNPQMPQPVQIYPQAMGPAAAYGMSPGGPAAAVRQMPASAQFVAPPGPNMPGGGGSGGHMMTNQPSAGPYMGIPVNPQQMQMYSPSPGHAFPHHAGGGPPPPLPIPPQGGSGGGPPHNSNGYPSPRPPAPMMSHQGSQQGHGHGHGHGHQPIIYMTAAGGQGGQGPPQMFAQGPGGVPSK